MSLLFLQYFVQQKENVHAQDQTLNGKHFKNMFDHWTSITYYLYDGELDTLHACVVKLSNLASMNASTRILRAPN